MGKSKKKTADSKPASNSVNTDESGPVEMSEVRRMKLHEPRHPNLLDAMIAPQYEKEEPINHIEQAYNISIAEKIEELEPSDALAYGDEIEDTLNFSNGLMMIKLVEEAIEKLRQKGANFESLLKRKSKLEAILAARKEEIAFKMSRVPMLKLMDKIYFMCGVSMCMVFAYCLGRYPRDAFLIFFTALIIPLVFWRWRNYVSIGMHYYLIDLCYFSTALILYNIWFDR